jgi:hypothetical protein
MGMLAPNATIQRQVRQLQEEVSREDRDGSEGRPVCFVAFFATFA